MITRRTSLSVLAVLALLVPAGALAYINPEDVLLNRELFLPPSAREADARTNLQTEESAARRDREQERAFALQHPEEEEETVTEEPAATHEAAADLTDTNLGATDLELLRTMRLLTRVQQNQQVLQYPTQTVMHYGAPQPLAPTGAGSILAAVTMLGAVGWTIRKAKRAESNTRI